MARVKNRIYFCACKNEISKHQRRISFNLFVFIYLFIQSTCTCFKMGIKTL